MKLSIGFEFETQWMSLVKVKGHVLSNPEYHYRVPLSKDVWIYPDEFTKGFAFDEVRKQFLKNKTGCGKYTTEDSIFKNAEFVITYPDVKEVEDVHEFIFQNMKHAIEQIEKQYQLFHIEYTFPELFPYRYLLARTFPQKEFSKMGLLCRGDPKTFMTEANMSPQCTFGCEVKNAMNLFGILSVWYEEKTGGITHRVLIDELKNIVQKTKWKTEWQNFLFLFLYAERTRTKRKTGSLFAIRHSFQDIWRYCIGKDGREMIYEWLQYNEEEYAYRFYEITYKPIMDQQEKWKRQDLLEVGLLPFRRHNGMFFFEFRGLYRILKSEHKILTLKVLKEKN